MKASPVTELVRGHTTSKGLLEIKVPAVYQGAKLCKDSSTEWK